jgi:3-hydroxybutyryl-CoA dehydrogenase
MHLFLLKILKMVVGILADDIAYNYLSSIESDIIWKRFDSIDDLVASKTDLIINFMDDAAEGNYHQYSNAIFINGVFTTLEGSKLPENVVRFNGWKSFYERTFWEVAGEFSNTHEAFIYKLNKKYHLFADNVGFPSTNIISMIINEAYFALEENVSSKAEIDIAMKLGTNYPKGPFEWSSIIGLKNVFQLLHNLSLKDRKYTPASLLLKETEQL